MLTEIMPGLFQSRLPFQGNPLRDINVYIIKDKDKSLIVDNGIDLAETRQELLDDIRKLELDLKNTEFFITHSHPDHCSNTPILANSTSVIYLNKADIEMLNYGSGEMQERHIKRNACLGVPDGDFFQDNVIKPVHPMRELAIQRRWQFSSPVDGDNIKTGDFSFHCLETPGHSQGHICLYEPDKKVLLCGDHILQKVTPVILPFGEDDNPLEEYLASLEKVSKLNVRLALPGHRSVISNVKERIQAIKHHHEARLNEILNILVCPSGAGLNTYQIAGRMHWDVSYKSWESFPIWQRMIATAEAESHLRYLAVTGRVRVHTEGKLEIYYAV